MVGWAVRRPVRRAAGPAAPGRLSRARSPRWCCKQKLGARTSRRASIHRVIAWDAVGETEGTGIVHIAPGCGKEDFQLGKERRPAAGRPARRRRHLPARLRPAHRQVRASIPRRPTGSSTTCKRRACCSPSSSYPHSYPHCWRCKTELLFRLVDEWFINMTWRDEIMDVVEQVDVPARVDQRPGPRAGLAQEHGRLDDLQEALLGPGAADLGLTSRRGDFEVIGSREELKERAVEGWDEFDGHTPHRPWIDQVKIRNAEDAAT